MIIYLHNIIISLSGNNRIFHTCQITSTLVHDIFEYDYIMQIYYHSFYIYLQSRSSYILIFYFLFHISHIENTIHWFGSSSMSPITDCYDRTEILLRVVFNSHIASSIMIVIQYSLQEFQDTVKNNVTKIAKCFVSLQIHVDFFIIELNRQSLYYL
jgi:hypothetical protein